MFEFFVNHFLGNLPVWLWPAIAGAGFGAWILSGILSHFPQFKPWMMIAKPVSVLICIFGIFMYGGAGVTAIYQQALEEAQQRVAVAEQASKDATGAVQTKVVTQVKVIHDQQIVYKDRIIKDAAKMDAECTVDPVAIKDLNDSAVNPIKATK